MFPLLGFSTEILLWAVTTISLVAIIVFWNHLGRNAVLHIFLRVFIIIFVQVFALAAIGVTINRAGDFYESWGDLFGSKKNLAKIAISPEALAGISAKDILAARHTPGGSLVFRLVINGKASKISDVVYVVTSPKISRLLESKNNPSIGSDYQVVELFPGYPGVPQTWIGTLGGITTMENLENANQIKPTIAIIPAINVVAGQDTECLDFVGGAQVETWLTADMKTLATSFLGIDNRSWSSFGYSTGGWCAAMVAVRHPDQYRRGISLAGYFEPSFSAGINRRERSYLSSKYDLIKTLKSSPTSLKMLVIASKRDRNSYASTQRFISRASNYISVKFDEIPNGGHNIAVWHPYVETGFLWLKATE